MNIIITFLLGCFLFANRLHIPIVLLFIYSIFV